VPCRGARSISIDPHWAAILQSRVPAVDYWSANVVMLPPVVAVSPTLQVSCALCGKV
jgi:hypothetical protein